MLQQCCLGDHGRAQPGHDREIASSLGVRTPAVDTLTFALSSGLAGIAGWREPLQLFAAVVTIVSGSVVYYAFGLHKLAAPLPLPAPRVQSR